MELSPGVELILIISVVLVFFLAWAVTIADILHQGGLTGADRTLWILLATFVPFLGMLVYWLLSNKLSASDPTSGPSSSRSGRSPRRTADLPADETKL
jgi:hypothetical protein